MAIFKVQLIAILPILAVLMINAADVKLEKGKDEQPKDAVTVKEVKGELKEPVFNAVKEEDKNKKDDEKQHGDLEAKGQQAEEPVPSYAGSSEFKEVVDMAESIKAMAVNPENKKSKAYGFITALDKYFNPHSVTGKGKSASRGAENNEEQVKHFNLIVHLLKTMHDHAGYGVVPMYRVIAEFLYRLPSSPEAVKGATENDKTILARMATFHGNYSEKLRASFWINEERYKFGISQEFNGQLITVPDPKNPEKMISVDRVDYERKKFKAEKAADPERLALDTLHLLIDCLSLTEACTDLDALRADIISKFAMLIRQVVRAGDKFLSAPFKKTIIATASEAESAAAKYFPLYSSPLFWTILAILGSILAFMAASVIIF